MKPLLQSKFKQIHFSIVCRHIVFVILFVYSLCISGIAHASNTADNEQVIKTQDDLVYTMVNRTYLSKDDVQFTNFDPVTKNPITSIPLFFNDTYASHKGALITTIEQFYDNTKIDNPKMHSFSTDIQCLIQKPMMECGIKDDLEDLNFRTIEDDCLSKIKVYQCNTQNSNIDTLHKQAIDDNIFAEINEQWVTNNHPTMSKNEASNYNFSYVNDISADLVLSLKGSLNEGESQEYSVLVTSYYVTAKKPFFFEYLNGTAHLSIYKGLTLVFVLLIFGSMLYTRRDWATRNTFVMGGLLVALGLINAMVWDIHYMVIGTAFIALAGTLLLFGNGLGKLMYLLGALLIAIMASLKFGVNTRQFFAQITLLFTIALFVAFLDDNHVYQEKDDDDEITRSMDEEELRKYAKIRARRDEATNITKESGNRIARNFAITLFVIMLIAVVVQLIRL